jgi:hypothetical protein
VRDPRFFYAIVALLHLHRSKGIFCFGSWSCLDVRNSLVMLLVLAGSSSCYQMSGSIVIRIFIEVMIISSIVVYGTTALKSFLPEKVLIVRSQAGTTGWT